MHALYNDFEAYPCDILELRIKDGWLPPGIVDRRSIVEVCQSDLSKFGQVHLFAGIGGFALGARSAGLPDSFPILTAGFPCQPFSTAGQRKGTLDHRYLWPETFAVIKAHRPLVCVLENVAGLASMAFSATETLVDIQADLTGQIAYHYKKQEQGVLETICRDLEGEGYSVQSLIIPACGVGAPHKRDRIWIVAYAECKHGRDVESFEKWCYQEKIRKQNTGQIRRSSTKPKPMAYSQVLHRNDGNPHTENGNLQTQEFRSSGSTNNVSNTTSGGRKGQRKSVEPMYSEANKNWEASQLINDGQPCFWPPEPSVGRVVNGLPNRVDSIKSLGNSIVVQVATEIFTAIKYSFFGDG